MFKKSIKRKMLFLVAGLILTLSVVFMKPTTANAESISVADAITNNSGTATVEGYIVGHVVSATNIDHAAPFANDYNLAIADNINETDPANMLFIKLATGFRPALGLSSNPDNVGKKVQLTGTLKAYFAKPGMDPLSSYVFVSADPAMTDSDAVAADLAELEVGFTNPDTLTSTTKNVTLPTSGTNGTEISWASTNEVVIATDGTVTRPANEDGDATVTLTATITKGSESDTKVFNLTVIAQLVIPDVLTVDEAINLFQGMADLTVEGYIVGTVKSGPALEVTTFVASNIAIASTPDETDISKMLLVALPTGEIRNALNLLDNPGNLGIKIQITGSLETYYSAPGLKSPTSYEIIVTDAEAVAASKTNLDLGDLTSVTTDLTLAGTGLYNTTITWGSSNKDVISEAGVVSRPVYGTGNVVVTLTATITRGLETETKTFEVTVVELEKAPLEINLNGEQRIYKGVGESYTDLGANSAYPVTTYVYKNGVYMPDFELSSAITENGIYFIYYQAIDGDDIVQTYRRIQISDGVNPEINLNGDQLITVNPSDSYTDLGAISDVTINTYVYKNGIYMPDFDLSSPISENGIYYIYYQAVDIDGDITQTHRRIRVSDGIVPELSLNGDQLISIHTGDSFTDLGATSSNPVNIYVYKNGVYMPGFDLSSPFTDNGIYIIYYQAVDSIDGDIAQTYRRIRVSDGIAPELSLKGNQIITLNTGESFTDLGATSDATIKSYVYKNGVYMPDFDLSTPFTEDGLYFIYYQAIDSVDDDITQTFRRVHIK